MCGLFSCSWLINIGKVVVATPYGQLSEKDLGLSIHSILHFGAKSNRNLTLQGAFASYHVVIYENEK